MDWSSINNVTVNFAKKRMYIDSNYTLTSHTKVLTAVNKISVIQRVADLSEEPVQLLKSTCLGKFNCMNGCDGIYPINDIPENKSKDETHTQTKHPLNNILITRVCRSELSNRRTYFVS